MTSQELRQHSIQQIENDLQNRKDEACEHDLHIFQGLFVWLKTNIETSGKCVSFPDETSLNTYAFYLSSFQDFQYNIGFLQDKIDDFKSYIKVISTHFTQVVVSFYSMTDKFLKLTKERNVAGHLLIEAKYVFDDLYIFQYNYKDKEWKMSLNISSLKNLLKVKANGYELQVYAKSRKPLKQFEKLPSYSVHG